MKITKKEAKEKFENLNAELIDPNDEHYWSSLSYGFFLGLGFDVDEAQELSIEVEQ